MGGVSTVGLFARTGPAIFSFLLLCSWKVVLAAQVTKKEEPADPKINRLFL
jgi:hypothetical protein